MKKKVLNNATKPIGFLAYFIAGSIESVILVNVMRYYSTYLNFTGMILFLLGEISKLLVSAVLGRYEKKLDNTTVFIGYVYVVIFILINIKGLSSAMDSYALTSANKAMQESPQYKLIEDSINRQKLTLTELRSNIPNNSTVFINDASSVEGQISNKLNSRVPNLNGVMVKLGASTKNCNGNYHDIYSKHCREVDTLRNRLSDIKNGVAKQKLLEQEKNEHLKKIASIEAQIEKDTQKLLEFKPQSRLLDVYRVWHFEFNFFGLIAVAFELLVIYLIFMVERVKNINSNDDVIDVEVNTDSYKSSSSVNIWTALSDKWHKLKGRLKRDHLLANHFIALKNKDNLPVLGSNSRGLDLEKYKNGESYLVQSVLSELQEIHPTLTRKEFRRELELQGFVVRLEKNHPKSTNVSQKRLCFIWTNNIQAIDI